VPSSALIYNVKIAPGEGAIWGYSADGVTEDRVYGGRDFTGHDWPELKDPTNDQLIQAAVASAYTDGYGFSADATLTIYRVTHEPHTYDWTGASWKSR